MTSLTSLMKREKIFVERLFWYLNICLWFFVCSFNALLSNIHGVEYRSDDAFFQKILEKDTAILNLETNNAITKDQKTELEELFQKQMEDPYRFKRLFEDLYKKDPNHKLSSFLQKLIRKQYCGDANLYQALKTIITETDQEKQKTKLHQTHLEHLWILYHMPKIWRTILGLEQIVLCNPNVYQEQLMEWLQNTSLGQKCQWYDRSMGKQTIYCDLSLGWNVPLSAETRQYIRTVDLPSHLWQSDLLQKFISDFLFHDLSIHKESTQSGAKNLIIQLKSIINAKNMRFALLDAMTQNKSPQIGHFLSLFDRYCEQKTSSATRHDANEKAMMNNIDRHYNNLSSEDIETIKQIMSETSHSGLFPWKEALLRYISLTPSSQLSQDFLTPNELRELRAFYHGDSRQNPTRSSTDRSGKTNSPRRPRTVRAKVPSRTTKIRTRPSQASHQRPTKIIYRTINRYENSKSRKKPKRRSLINKKNAKKKNNKKRNKRLLARRHRKSHKKRKKRRARRKSRQTQSRPHRSSRPR